MNNLFVLLKRRINLILLSLIIIFAIILRLPSFFLSHYNNDELIHISLAKKVDKYGFDVFKKGEYNLFFLDKGFNPEGQFIGILDGKKETGSLLEGFLAESEKLSHHPPGLPLFIAMSHKIFSNNKEYLINVSQNDYLMAQNLGLQFYACFIPFLISILLIISVCLLGSIFFSRNTGLLASLIFSVIPIELLTSNKIWADDMVALFATLAVILFLYAIKGGNPFFCLLSGLSCGFSILAKMSGVYIVISILLFHLLINYKKKASIKNIKDFIFDRNILYFLAGVFIVSAWWFNLYYSYFNIASTKSYFIVNEQWETAKTWNSFFGTISNRPWFAYFILVPFQSPLLILSYIFIPFFMFRRRIGNLANFVKNEYSFIQFLIFWILTTFIFLTLKPGKELRYMLIAYPAICILSSYSLDLIYQWLKNKFPKDVVFIRFILVFIIFSSLLFSLKLGLPRVIFRSDLIPIPL